MADKQPEALWLADAMDCVTDDACGYCMPCRIAAELRRLSAVEAERDALRAALELYRGQVDQTGRHSAADAIKLAIRQGK